MAQFIQRLDNPIQENVSYDPYERSYQLPDYLSGFGKAPGHKSFADVRARRRRAGLIAETKKDEVNRTKSKGEGQ